jgi:fibronectin type 3 domain-containing protein
MMTARRIAYLVPVMLLLLAWPGRAQTKTHCVALNWTASAGDLTFNIYRSTATGTGYTKIGSSPTTIYSDCSGVGGTKYFYVVTGVDSGGFESANSNEASASFLANPAPPTGLQAVSN